MEAHQVCHRNFKYLSQGHIYTYLYIFRDSCPSPRLCVFQVSQVFDLETSACSGELAFMERYREVLLELDQVEQKMESQSVSSSSSSSEGLGVAAVSGPGRCRLGSSGRSTLQAIGSAAAAGASSSSRPSAPPVGWGCELFLSLLSCRCSFLLDLRHRRPAPQHPGPPSAVTGGRLLAEPVCFRPLGPPFRTVRGAQPRVHGCFRLGLLPLSPVEDIPPAAGHCRASAQRQLGGSRFAARV